MSIHTWLGDRQASAGVGTASALPGGDDQEMGINCTMGGEGGKSCCPVSMREYWSIAGGKEGSGQGS